MAAASPQALAQHSEGLQAFNAVSLDSLALLKQLDKHLGKLNVLNLPIYEQANKLTWAEDRIAATQAATDKLLGHLSTPRKVEPVLRGGPGRDVEKYVRALQQLGDAMQHLATYKGLQVAQEAFLAADKVQQKAMRDCEADFLTNLVQQTNATLPSATVLIELTGEGGSLQTAFHEAAVPEFTEKAVERLTLLSELMLVAQHDTCMDVYSQVRGKALTAVLRGTGWDPAAIISHLATQEQMEKSAAGWSRHLRVLTVLAASEMQLASLVWADLLDKLAKPQEEQQQPSQKTKSKRKVQKENMVPTPTDLVACAIAQPLGMLAQQGQAIASGRALPAKVFVLLDMVRDLEEVMPLLDELVAISLTCDAALGQLRELQLALSKGARAQFEAFESTIAHDTSKAQVINGTVHPLTASALSYLRRLFTYQGISQILFIAPGQGGGGLAELAGPVAERRMLWAIVACMQALLQALEVKSRGYKNKALAALFLMNNVHYMVVTVEQSESLSVLGTEWVEKHKDIIDQHGRTYFELVWEPLVQKLQAVQSGEDPEPSDVEKWKEWVKRHFKAVNKVVDGVHLEQSTWNIPDAKLRKSVRKVVLQDLLPPYTAFYEAYSQATFSTTPHKYVKYSPKDIEDVVSVDLFIGRPSHVPPTHGLHAGVPDLAPSVAMSAPEQPARTSSRTSLFGRSVKSVKPPPASVR